MSFATPIPDMSNRAPRNRVAGAGRMKVGRPVNDDAYRIRTVAWFNAVANGLDERRPGTIGGRMQDEADARSLHANHSTSKRWYRYAKGTEGPESDTLDFVNEVVPGTAQVFQDGPADIWTALWTEFAPQFDEDEVAARLSMATDQVDALWLSKVIISWRNRAAVMRFGSFDNLIDGLYEAVFLGLNHQETELRRLGVWELLCENITNTERINLRADPRKLAEIEAVGRRFSDDPVEFYLSKPLEFALTAMKEK